MYRKIFPIKYVEYKQGAEMKNSLVIKYKNDEDITRIYFNTVVEARNYFRSVVRLYEKSNIEYAYLRYYKDYRNHIKYVFAGDVSHLSIADI